MMEVSVNTTRAELIPPREPLTPGMVNAVQIKFTFSDEWNGLEKTCVFSNELESVPAIIESDIVSVPTEVLDVVYRWISVGVTGEDSEGNVVIPTIWCRIGQCLPGVSGKFVTIDQLQAYWSKQEVMFELDGDGTRFFGDDGQYHYVAQGGGDVTHEQLEAAIAPLAVKDDVDAALAEKADASALADYATVAALDAKADKTELADYYAKSDITLTTSGTGDKFLADDGTYKTVQGGGGGVTREELDAAIAPLATTAATDAALALKADKTELGSYAKQYDVNQALATKADKTEIAGLATKTEVETALAGKADNATLTNYALKSELPDTSQFASKSDLNLLTAEVADKADKSEIITVSDGDGTKFLADDGTYKTVQGADEKTFVAEYNVTTAQEIIEYLDAAKEPFAPMLVKRGADYYTVTTAAKQDANKVIIRTFATLSGNYYMFTYTITGNTWASSSYGFQKLLESGTNIKTINGQSLLGSGDIPISSAAQVQANWTETDDTSPAYIQNKPIIPDVSGFETTAHAEATYATKTELATKADSTAMDTALAEKADADDVNAALALKADKTEIITKTDGTGTLFLADDGTYKPAAGDPPDLSAYLTKTEAAGEYATKTELAGKADAADIPDVSGFETATHAAETYATKTEVADKADSATVTALSGVVTGHTAEIAALQTGKADKSEIPDVSGFETTTHAAETYATKTELTEGLADKADSADIADMLTKTEAAGTYADKVSVLTLENTIDAQGTSIRNLADTKADKTQIITVTSGSGTLFLADDGTYKPAAGDPPDLSAYLTKTEAGTTYTTITHAEATYATKEDVTIADNELQEAIDLKADASALADYETTAHASATYATKAELPVVDSTLIPGSPNPVSNDAVVTGFATYGTQIEQLNAQVVANAEAIEGLESSKANVGDIPDVSGFETTAHAEATYATKTELGEKADRTQLQGYLTKMEASETYETIARASKIKSLTAAGHAVTVTDDGLANVGGTTVRKLIGSMQPGVANVGIGIIQTLPATEEDTPGEGYTLNINYKSETSGAITEYSNFTIDGVPIVTKDDLQTAGGEFIKQITQNLLYEVEENAGWIYQRKVLTPDANGNVEITAAHTTWAAQPLVPGATLYSWTASDKHQDVIDGYPLHGKGCGFRIETKVDNTSRNASYVDITYVNIPLAEGTGERPTDAYSVRLLPHSEIASTYATKTELETGLDSKATLTRSGAATGESGTSNWNIMQGEYTLPIQYTTDTTTTPAVYSNLTIDGVPIVTKDDLQTASGGFVKQITQIIPAEAIQDANGNQSRKITLVPDASGNIDLVTAHSTFEIRNTTRDQFIWTISDRSFQPPIEGVEGRVSRNVVVDIDKDHYTDPYFKKAHFRFEAGALQEGSMVRPVYLLEVDLPTKDYVDDVFATKTALEAKADRTQLQGYLTKTEASETYETIARASKIKSITSAGHAVTVTDEGLANVGGTKVTKTSVSPQIGVSDVSIAVQQILPATEEATTGEGETLPITYTSTTSGALTSYSNFTLDGVPIATKDELTTATTDMATQTWVQQYIASLDGTNMKF